MQIWHKSFLAVFGIALVGSIGFGAKSFAEGPTTADLTADIAKLDEQISELDLRCQRYGSGSVLNVQCELERSVLGTTRAMLDQKRSAWLRGISLTYTVEGKPVAPLSPEEKTGLEQQIAEAELRRGEAQIKADRYGGLIGTMAAAEVQTQRVTIAMLRQKYVMRELGFAYPSVGPISKKEPDPPVGKTVDDKDAL